MSWWLLMFASPDRALGAVYMEADSAAEAQAEAEPLAPHDFDEVAIIGPMTESDMETHVPLSVRSIFLPVGHPHLGPPIPSEQTDEIAAAYGAEYHRHGKIT